MAYIQSVRGKHPTFGAGCWLAPNATLVGEVSLGEECSIWFQAVLRGDVNPIHMGHRCNVQDGAVIHCTFERSTVQIGNEVSIGHNATIHGCQIANNVLVGMGAIVMDGAILEEGSLIAAGAVVLEGTVAEGGYIYAGTPARKIKRVDGEAKKMLLRTAGNYVKYATWFKNAQT